MEGSLRWVAVTAIAPVSWGATYAVTRHALPPDSPLWGAALRALPAAAILLLLVRRAPRGAWWWRSALLGALNAAAIAAATLGFAGVAVMLGTDPSGIDLAGVAASATALVASSVGYALATRWKDEAGLLASTAWQVAAGGLVLLVAALAVEGAPPPLDGQAVAGFAYVSLIATALAYVAWFAGLRRLPAASVGLVGLLNPVTGLALGALAGERLAPVQVAGAAAVLVAVVLGQPRARQPVDRPQVASQSAR